MSKIPYDLTRIKAVAFDVDGVLSTATINLGSDGQPVRTVNTKDGYAMQLAVKKGIHLAIISGAASKGVRERYENLGIKDIHLGVGKKLPVLQEWISRLGLTPEEVAYVGDDIPDYECMRYVGLGVAPKDSAVDILQIADYISPVVGGYGVARDLLEELMRSQDLWVMNEKAFGW